MKFKLNSVDIIQENTSTLNAPVVLFAYNRPVHLKKVLDALSKCKGAIDTDLYIYCDGPKAESDDKTLANILDVRSIAQRESRFRNTSIVIREENLGLGRSVIDGVTKTINQYGCVIVLEDDLVVHKDFLLYMNYYINLYRKNPNIYHITGFQRDNWLQFFLKRIYFTRHMNCSGWATWADRWSNLVLDSNQINEYLKNSNNAATFNYVKLKYSDQLLLNKNGLRTWAIFWYSTIQIKNALCVNPKFSYVKNIGDDGSGTNMGVTNTNYVKNFSDKFLPYTPSKITESWLNRLYIREAYWKKSEIRLKAIKNIIFFLLSKLRLIIIGKAI